MRRGIGFTLICFGLFLVVLGGAVRYWAYDRLVVVPVDLYSTLDLPGRATYLDMATTKERTVDVVARQTVRADVDASSDRVLVVDLSQVISTADGKFIRAAVERAAIDRRTGAAVNCCDESVDGKPVRHDGYLFKLPFSAPREDVLLWDGTSASSNPARYEGTETIAGHLVHRYVSAVPGQQIRTQPDSGPLVGEARTFDAPVWNQSTKTLWVEPVTGTPLAVEVRTRTTLRNSRGQDVVTVFAATLSTDRARPNPETLALVEAGKRRIELVRQVPPVGVGVGATLACLGVALLVRRRRTARHAAPVSPAVAPQRRSPAPATEQGAAGSRPARLAAESRARRRDAESPALPPHPGGRHATGEFAVPTALRGGPSRSPEGRREAVPPRESGLDRPRPANREAGPPQARTWDVADIGPGRPVSPAPVADRPLSRYIRPYLDGDTGAHRRPAIDDGHRRSSERTGSHRAPDFDGDTGTHRLPDAPVADERWLTEIRPEGLGHHGRLDPADWSGRDPGRRLPSDSAAPHPGAGRPDGPHTPSGRPEAGCPDGEDATPPPRATRRATRYPDGW